MSTAVMKRNVACVKHRIGHRKCPEDCPGRSRETGPENDVDIKKLVQNFKMYRPPNTVMNHSVRLV